MRCAWASWIHFYLKLGFCVWFLNPVPFRQKRSQVLLSILDFGKPSHTRESFVNILPWWFPSIGSHNFFYVESFSGAWNESHEKGSLWASMSSSVQWPIGWWINNVIKKFNPWIHQEQGLIFKVPDSSVGRIINAQLRWESGTPPPLPPPRLCFMADLTKAQPKRASFLGSNNWTCRFLEQRSLCYVCSL